MNLACKCRGDCYTERSNLVEITQILKRKSFKGVRVEFLQRGGDEPGYA